MAIELPEAICLARQMNDKLTGKTIARVTLGPVSASLVKQGFINLDKVRLAGMKLGCVSSEGKWLFLKLEPDMYLLFALETGGKFLYHSDATSLPDKYHVRLEFADGSLLTEHIVGWGWAKALKPEELAQERYPGPLGMSPVDTDFTLSCLRSILSENSNKVIKYVLMDQRSIAGIGNGYVQEILFKAKLHPKRKVGDITLEESRRLHRAIVKTLNDAIRRGGSQWECDLSGRPGRYERIMGEHMLGHPCPECGTRIEKIAVLGGSSYVCPNCQK